MKFETKLEPKLLSPVQSGPGYITCLLRSIQTLGKKNIRKRTFRIWFNIRLRPVFYLSNNKQALVCPILYRYATIRIEYKLEVLQLDNNQGIFCAETYASVGNDNVGDSFLSQLKRPVDDKSQEWSNLYVPVQDEQELRRRIIDDPCLNITLPFAQNVKSSEASSIHTGYLVCSVCFRMLSYQSC